MALTQKIFGAHLILLLFIMTASGCVPSEQREIKNYFDAVVEIEKDIDKVFKNRESMDKEIQDKRPDFKRLQDSLKAQMDVLDNKIAEIKALPVPENAKKFHRDEIEGLEILRSYTTAYSERFSYLEQYYNLLQKDVKKMPPKEVIGIVNQIKNLTKKDSEYVKKLNALSEDASKNKKKIQMEQQRLAKQFNITLK